MDGSKCTENLVTHAGSLHVIIAAPFRPWQIIFVIMLESFPHFAWKMIQVPNSVREDGANKSNFLLVLWITAGEKLIV